MLYLFLQPVKLKNFEGFPTTYFGSSSLNGISPKLKREKGELFTLQTSLEKSSTLYPIPEQILYAPLNLLSLEKSSIDDLKAVQTSLM